MMPEGQAFHLKVLSIKQQSHKLRGSSKSIRIKTVVEIVGSMLLEYTYYLSRTSSKIRVLLMYKYFEAEILLL